MKDATSAEKIYSKKDTIFVNGSSQKVIIFFSVSPDVPEKLKKI